jgi:hypothetical protein
MFLSGNLKCDRLSENLNSAGYGLLEKMLMENDGICATGAIFYNRQGSKVLMPGSRAREVWYEV